VAIAARTRLFPNSIFATHHSHSLRSDANRARGRDALPDGNRRSHADRAV
jgi:hypothetical protein